MPTANTLNITTSSPVTFRDWANNHNRLVYDMSVVEANVAHLYTSKNTLTSNVSTLTANVSQLFSATTPAEMLTRIKTVDGSGSGLDADLLDGQTGAYYSNASNLSTGTLPAGRFNNTAHGNRGGGSLHSAATNSSAGFMSSSDKSKLDGIESGATADQTASEILTLIKTVDGSGSGLDADLVRGTTPGTAGRTVLAQATNADIRSTLSVYNHSRFSSSDTTTATTPLSTLTIITQVTFTSTGKIGQVSGMVQGIGSAAGTTNLYCFVRLIRNSDSTVVDSPTFQKSLIASENVTLTLAHAFSSMQVGTSYTLRILAHTDRNITLNGYLYMVTQ